MIVVAPTEFSHLPPPLQIVERTIAAPTSLQAARRRYWVREWLPSDGPFPAWQRDGQWKWGGYYPRYHNQYTTIVRLCDHQCFVFPTRWFECDQRGLPRDDDRWADEALSVIRAHYEAQAQWFQ